MPLKNIFLMNYAKIRLITINTQKRTNKGTIKTTRFKIITI